jgi:hypothetical protein
MLHNKPSSCIVHLPSPTVVKTVHHISAPLAKVCFRSDDGLVYQKSPDEKEGNNYSLRAANTTIPQKDVH